MASSMRYGLVGMVALALLTTVHWLRDQALPPEATRDYLLGVVPNFAAAIAITYVLLSIWSEREHKAGFAGSRRAFLICAGISGVGLLGWEMTQMASDRLVFDPHDIGATLLGLATARVILPAIGAGRPAKSHIPDDTPTPPQLG